MTEKTHDKEVDALKADIASLREEIAGLAAGVVSGVGSGLRRTPRSNVGWAGSRPAADAGAPGASLPEPAE